MESDAVPTSPAMPRSTPFETGRAVEPAFAERPPSSSIVARASDQTGRSGVFAYLVHDDADIAGLVAYSIYKQNKLDWLRAFEDTNGRSPDERELAAYIIGEGTPRRLATYRHLAEATLAGHGPEIDGMPGTVAPSRFAQRKIGEGMAIGTIALYGLIALLFVLGFYLALHFTATSR